MLRRLKVLIFCILLLLPFSHMAPRVYAADVPCKLTLSGGDGNGIRAGKTYQVTADLTGANLNFIRTASWKLDLIDMTSAEVTVGTIQSVQVGQANNKMTFSFTPSESILQGQQQRFFYLNFIPSGGGVTVNDCSSNDLTIISATAPTPTAPAGTLCYNITADSAAGLACTEVACPGTYSGPNGYANCQADLAARQPTATPDPGTATAFPTQIAPPAPACADYDAAKGICKKVDTGIGVLCTEANCFVAGLFAVMMSLSGGMATLIIIYAGYLYIISRGNPEQLQKAREMIISAIVGLLFIVFSFVLMETITGDILRLPGFDVFNQCNDRNNQC